MTEKVFTSFCLLECRTFVSDFVKFSATFLLVWIIDIDLVCEEYNHHSMCVFLVIPKPYPSHFILFALELMVIQEWEAPVLWKLKTNLEGNLAVKTGTRSLGMKVQVRRWEDLSYNWNHDLGLLLPKVNFHGRKGQGPPKGQEQSHPQDVGPGLDLEKEGEIHRGIDILLKRETIRTLTHQIPRVKTDRGENSQSRFQASGISRLQHHTGMKVMKIHQQILRSQGLKGNSKKVLQPLKLQGLGNLQR